MNARPNIWIHTEKNIKKQKLYPLKIEQNRKYDHFSNDFSQKSELY